PLTVLSQTADDRRRTAGELLLERAAVAVVVRPHDPPRADHPVHLVRAVVDAGGAGVAVHALERRVAGDAAGAVHLDRAVDDVVQHLRAPELDDRDLDASLIAAVDLLSRMQREQTRRLDLGSRISDPVLHGLL